MLRLPGAIMFFAFATLVSSTAFGSVSPASFVNATNKILADLGAFVGLGADLRAYESTIPRSSMAGFDMGATVSAVHLPGFVTDALSVLGVSNAPSFVPIPKINIQKALPGRLLIGSEFIPEIKLGTTRLAIYGVDLQWTAINRPRLPPIAIRLQYNYADLAFVRSVTWGGDLLVSWRFPVLDVYGGGGYRLVFSTITVPYAIPGPLSSSIDLNPKTSAGHFFAGTSLQAGFVRLTLESNFTTQGIHSHGTKFSFFF